MKQKRWRSSFIYKSFYKTLTATYGETIANVISTAADREYTRLCREHPDIKGDAAMMVLPAAALYKALEPHDPENALTLLKSYGTQTGVKLAKVIHGFTSIPGVPRLLWRYMPQLMRKMSSDKAGYTRRIVSETRELVGVDILSCPLHDAAVKIGCPDIAQVVCAMDKVYMTGFKHIRYTRTTSVADGDSCCDYRLVYDKTKM